MLADIPMLVSAYLDASHASTSTVICDAVAILTQFSNLSTMLWNAFILWTVYTTIFNNLVEEDLATIKTKLIVSSFIFPLILSICPVVVGKFIHADTSCWISTKDSSMTEYFIYDGIYLAAFFISFIYIIRYYIRMIVFLRQFTIEEVAGEFYALSLFPIVLIIANLPSVASRLSIIIFQNEFPNWVTYLRIGLRQSEVFLNSVLFLLNPKVWIALRRYCSKREKRKQSLLSLQDSSEKQLVAPRLRGNTCSSDDGSSNDGNLSNDLKNKSPNRHFTANPEFISKVFNVRASFEKGQIANKAIAPRRVTSIH